jgi:thioredoxin-like negative regulator of GroEL
MAVALATFSIVVGCNSTGNKEDLGGGLFSSVEGEIVVMRAGDKDPVISQFPRMKWLELKKTEKGPIRKMQAMLATGASLDAEREARSYLQGNPGDIDGILVLASALAQSRQYELADYYAELLEKNPETKAHGLNIKGLATLIGASSAADYRTAQNELISAHKANPKQIAAGLNLGALYLEIGNANAAVGIYQETSVRCSKCQPALLGYGIASLRSQKYKDAETALTDILIKNKNDGMANYHLALVYLLGQKNKSKAETVLKRLLQDETQGSSELRQRAQAILKKIKGDKDLTDDGFLDANLGGDEKTEEILTGHGK